MTEGRASRSEHRSCAIQARQSLSLPEALLCHSPNFAEFSQHRSFSFEACLQACLACFETSAILRPFQAPCLMAVSRCEDRSRLPEAMPDRSARPDRQQRSPRLPQVGCPCNGEVIKPELIAREFASHVAETGSGPEHAAMPTRDKLKCTTDLLGPWYCSTLG